MPKIIWGVHGKESERKGKGNGSIGARKEPEGGGVVFSKGDHVKGQKEGRSPKAQTLRRERGRRLKLKKKEPDERGSRKSVRSKKGRRCRPKTTEEKLQSEETCCTNGGGGETRVRRLCERGAGCIGGQETA